ncbi:MAG: hypothetical protein FWG80_01320 [Alphaproteobacteria bacterium]|nr:hypothetical protein [Alphaproteobacteria bacterium]
MRDLKLFFLFVVIQIITCTALAQQTLRIGQYSIPLTPAAQLSDIPSNSLRILTDSGHLYYSPANDGASSMPMNSLRMKNYAGQTFYFDSEELGYGEPLPRPDNCDGSNQYWNGNACKTCDNTGEIPDPSHSGCICDAANKYYGTPGSCTLQSTGCPAGSVYSNGNCEFCAYQYYSSGIGACIECSRWSGRYWNPVTNTCNLCADAMGAICTDANRTEIRQVYIGFNCVDYAVPNYFQNKCELRCPGANQYWNGTACAHCDGVVNATHTACNTTGNIFSCPETITQTACTSMGGLLWGGCSCDWDGCFMINDTDGALSCHKIGIGTTDQICANLGTLPIGHSSCGKSTIPWN